MMEIRTLGFATALMAIAAMPTAAQDFPTRPLALVVAYAAGAPPDIAARILVRKMSEALGQQIVVENDHLVLADDAYVGCALQGGTP